MKIFNIHTKNKDIELNIDGYVLLIIALIILRLMD